jgi:RNase P/RNase MRP subunit p29
MMGIIGREVSVVSCPNVGMVGLKGVVALESLKTLTVRSPTRTVTLPKLGTVLKLADTGRIVLGDDMKGRIVDRLSRGARI